MARRTGAKGPGRSPAAVTFTPLGLSTTTPRTNDDAGFCQKSTIPRQVVRGEARTMEVHVGLEATRA